MKSAALRYWLVMLALCAIFYGSLKLWQNYQPDESQSDQRAVAIARAHAAPTIDDLDKTVKPFDLIDEQAQPFSSKQLEGKVWVASFFFTNCPGTCWQLNQANANLQTETDPEVKLVSITCDPKNDTPEALARYAKHFKADPERWSFLTGDFKQIEKIGRESFLVAVKVGVHSDRAMVVDRTGKVRGAYNMLKAEQVAKLKDQVKDLLAEPAGSSS